MQFPDYPFKSHFAKINGLRMHYVDEGDNNAPVLLMVHGNPTWSFYYRRIISALSDRYRCIAPDHIGMGLSDKPGPVEYAFDLATRVQDLEAFLDSIDVKNDIRLMVHDWGGMIGMGYATRHPGRIKNLVISNTAAFHLPADQSLPWQLKLGRSFMAPFLIKGMNAFCRGAISSCVKQHPMDKRTTKAYLAPYDNWHNRHAVLQFVQDIPIMANERSYETVSGIGDALHLLRQHPTLLLWGMKDFVFTEKFLNVWTEKLPGAHLHRYPEAGHYLLEDAHTEVIPVLKDFLD